MSDAEISLADLAPGATARILKINNQNLLKKRLMEMGLVRGAIISKVKLAPLADPAEYVIKNFHVSLRREEARDVMVEVLKTQTDRREFEL